MLIKCSDEKLFDEKCSDARERKRRNMLELDNGEKGADEDQWKQPAEVLKGLSDSQKWGKRWTDESTESEMRSDRGRGRDGKRRR